MNRMRNVMIEGQNYYQSNKKRIWILGTAVLILLVLFSLCFATKTVQAQRSGERVQRISSVEIQRGDTLWSIASEYMSDEYDSVKNYIEVIKDSNGMVSDEIHTGNYIIVPYYADAN